MKDRAQFNARVPTELAENARKVADQADFTRDELGLAAFDALFGTKDKLRLAKLQRVREIAKHLNLSFDAPENQPLGMAV